MTPTMERNNPLKLHKIINYYYPLADEILQSLSEIACFEEFSKGEIIAEQGQPYDNLFIIGEGITRISYRKDNCETTLCFDHGGDIFTSFHSLFASEPSIFTLQALENVNGWRIPFARFVNLESRYPELAMWMQKMLIEQFFSFEVLYSNHALCSPTEKYDNFQNYVMPNMQHVSTKSLTRALPLKYLAQYLGITPQTLSKIRRHVVGK